MSNDTFYFILHIFNCDIMKKNIIIFLVLLSICIKNVNSNKFPINSNINNIVFIDPGHGGKDNGASYNNILEDTINLQLATILYEMILTSGMTCYLTRVSDYDLSSNYSKNHKLEDLNNRIKYIDSMDTTLFISLHLNYFKSSNVNGIQVFYQSSNNESKILASIMQEKLNKLNNKDKNIKNENIYILKNTKTTGILVEYGFLSNEEDRNKLIKKTYLKLLAKTIKNGIDEYLMTL